MKRDYTSLNIGRKLKIKKSTEEQRCKNLSNDKQ